MKSLTVKVRYINDSDKDRGYDSSMILRSLEAKDRDQDREMLHDKNAWISETFLIKFLMFSMHKRHLFLQKMNLFMIFFFFLHNFLNLMSRKAMFYWFNFFFQLRQLALSFFYQGSPDYSIMNIHGWIMSDYPGDPAFEFITKVILV